MESRIQKGALSGRTGEGGGFGVRVGGSMASELRFSDFGLRRLVCVGIC